MAIFQTEYKPCSYAVFQWRDKVGVFVLWTLSCCIWFKKRDTFVMQKELFNYYDNNVKDGPDSEHSVKSVFTHVAKSYANLLEKGFKLMTRIQLPQGHQHGYHFHFSETPIGLP